MAEETAQTRTPLFTRRAFTAAGAAGLMVAGCTSTTGLGGGSGLIADTTSGRVRGLESPRGLSFKGIRYGAPTGGAARFKAPRLPDPWTGIADAYEFGPQCPQFNQVPLAGREDFMRIYGSTIPTSQSSEDCLFLNVWTRSLDRTAKRPVMVYIHGGRWLGGSGNTDGSALVDRGDVVVVSLNHRLGVFGYLHLAEFAGESHSASGNVGIMDVVQALQWIQDNIETFGGDPGRVTVFGQSGGCQKISMLLGTPAAQGKFHGAIMMSGGGKRMLTAEQATQNAEFTMRHVGVDPTNWQEMETIPAEQLLAAQKDLVQELRMDHFGGLVGGFAGVVDGNYLPDHPFDGVAPSVSADVPIMVGVTGFEMSMYALAFPPILEATEEQVAPAVRPRLGECTETIINTYKEAHPELSPGLMICRIMGDYPLGIHSNDIAEAKSKLGAAPAYAYQVSYGSAVETSYGYVIDSPHSIDVALAFDITETRPDMYGDTPGTLEAAANVSSTWISFARNGDPNNDRLPDWAPFSMPDRPTMMLDTTCELVIEPDKEVYDTYRACSDALTRQIPLMDM
ncbi:MAG: carboxylesterase family protein [Hyphomonadaceae bacterium]|nr:carboxylesterase family protein [Hyphomonadaceae bacterium]